MAWSSAARPPVTRSAAAEIGYVMSKGALDAMGRSLAASLGPRGITVNTVAPGLTATDVWPSLRDRDGEDPGAVSATALGRVGRPEDIADAVAFLASDQGRWITGHVLDATGGLYLRPRRPITRATR
ncbi:MAG: SDR family oxidoreductase [Pseudonocardia sp.]|nr:SDR family oxidoreductase [Pseudonocardia sp.]